MTTPAPTFVSSTTNSASSVIVSAGQSVSQSASITVPSSRSVSASSSSNSNSAMSSTPTSSPPASPTSSSSTQSFTPTTSPPASSSSPPASSSSPPVSSPSPLTSSSPPPTSSSSTHSSTPTTSQSPPPTSPTSSSSSTRASNSSSTSMSSPSLPPPSSTETSTSFTSSPISNSISGTTSSFSLSSTGSSSSVSSISSIPSSSGPSTSTDSQSVSAPPPSSGSAPGTTSGSSSSAESSITSFSDTPTATIRSAGTTTTSHSSVSFSSAREFSTTISSATAGYYTTTIDVTTWYTTTIPGGGMTTVMTVVPSGSLVPNSPNGASNRLSHHAGAIAGLVVGVTFAVGLLTAWAIFVWRGHKRRRLEATALEFGDGTSLARGPLDEDEDDHGPEMMGALPIPVSLGPGYGGYGGVANRMRGGDGEGAGVASGHDPPLPPLPPLPTEEEVAMGRNSSSALMSDGNGRGRHRRTSSGVGFGQVVEVMGGAGLGLGGAHESGVDYGISPPVSPTKTTGSGRRRSSISGLDPGYWLGGIAYGGNGSRPGSSAGAPVGAGVSYLPVAPASPGLVPSWHGHEAPESVSGHGHDAYATGLVSSEEHILIPSGGSGDELMPNVFARTSSSIGHAGPSSTGHGLVVVGRSGSSQERSSSSGHGHLSAAGGYASSSQSHGSRGAGPSGVLGGNIPPISFMYQSAAGPESGGNGSSSGGNVSGQSGSGSGSGANGTGTGSGGSSDAKGKGKGKAKDVEGASGERSGSASPTSTRGFLSKSVPWRRRGSKASASQLFSDEGVEGQHSGTRTTRSSYSNVTTFFEPPREFVTPALPKPTRPPASPLFSRVRRPKSPKLTSPPVSRGMHRPGHSNFAPHHSPTLQSLAREEGHLSPSSAEIEEWPRNNPLLTLPPLPSPAAEEESLLNLPHSILRVQGSSAASLRDEVDYARPISAGLVAHRMYSTLTFNTHDTREKNDSLDTHSLGEPEQTEFDDSVADTPHHHAD
ncbi:hypothetical protein JAAARDRAFT_56376 [Jaapia argillacea MUCL 33604]|uniref:Uncharacterized protein n=1 Tax=Jaapia argillacea MUCL 33604 TaxID=933084 RepID=A0A067Q2X2_9AGAM|nr:hypothetical protein JAAARDRAFT_56376 [Jaapia argillacea MUCL 33604]